MAKPAYIYDGTQWVPIGPSLGPNSPVAYQTSAPSSPYTGQVWTDSDEGQKILRVWTGSAWALYDGYSTTTPSVTTYASGAYTLALADRDGIVNLRGGTNLVTNSSFETDLSGWATTGVTNTRSTDWSVIGTASIKTSPNSVSIDCHANISSTASALGIVGGQTYTVSAYCYLPTAQSGSLDGRARQIVVYYQTASTGGSYFSFASNIASNATGVTRLVATGTFPADVTAVLIRLYNGATNSAANAVYYDAVLLEAGSTLNPYFDNTYACVVTVPTNASAAFPLGTRTQLVNTSSGTVSVVGASGVTMTGVQTIASHQMMTLIKLGTDSWERISAVSSETGIHSFTSMGA